MVHQHVHQPQPLRGDGSNVDVDKEQSAMAQVSLQYDALTAVVDLALRVLLANPDSAIAFIHAVTVPCCARHLLPFVDEAGGLSVANQAWWVLAALWSVYGRNPPVVDAPTEAPEWADLLAAALRNGDEHAIKLTVAAQDQIDRVDELLLRSAVARVVTAG